MPLCEFEPAGDIFKCKWCGVVRPAKRLRSCDARPNEHSSSLPIEPGKFRQAVTYSAAVAKWIAAGRPTRSKAEIESILAICQACPMFVSDDRPRCRLCSCSINNSPDGLVNKIAMATESCPEKPPKWVASD